MTDLTSLRARPHSLVAGERMPVCQEWTYVTELGFDVIERAEFWLSVRDLLRVGDFVKVCRIIDRRVRQIARFIVVANDGSVIECLRYAPVIDLPAPHHPAATPAATGAVEAFVGSNGDVKWNVGKRAFDVLVDGKAVASVPDKGEAWRIAKGDVPVPSEEAA